MIQVPTVRIVDDDPAVRDALRLLMESAGLRAETWGTARDYLDTLSEGTPGCLVVDVQMPGINGLELQRELAARGSRLPIIFLTGHGDVPTAVEALRAGAIDFIEKPCDTRRLLQRIREAIELDARTRRRHAGRAEIAERLKKLTPRERQVLDHIVEGLATKAIAKVLGSSFNTVQNQRASILKKMDAVSVADLVRMVMIARAGEL